MLGLETLKRFIFFSNHFHQYCSVNTFNISPKLEVFGSDSDVLISEVLKRDKGSLKVLDISVSRYFKINGTPSQSCSNLQVLSFHSEKSYVIDSSIMNWILSLKNLREIWTNNDPLFYSSTNNIKKYLTSKKIFLFKFNFFF